MAPARLEHWSPARVWASSSFFSFSSSLGDVIGSREARVGGERRRRGNKGCFRKVAVD
jgi:hypothetical protein